MRKVCIRLYRIFQIKYLIFTGLFFLIHSNLFSQSSFNFLTPLQNEQNSKFNLSGFENNPANRSGIKDWEFSLIYGGEFQNRYTGNLYSISIVKSVNKHNFKFRYTPGHKKDFIFSSGISLINEELNSVLRSSIGYEENFGFGYSYNFSQKLSAGFNLRHFNQKFVTDNLITTFTDSTTLVSTETITETYGNLTGSIGADYSVNKNLKVNLSYINLFSGDDSLSDEIKDYRLRFEKLIQAGVNFNFMRNFSTHFIYQSNSSFEFGSNFSFSIFGNDLSIGISAFHDKYQTPYIAGILPAINYSTGIFSFSLGAVKYFSERKNSYSSNYFEENPVYDIMNNRFSNDKIFAGVNFALNTFPEQKVKFIDVQILQNIFPSLTDFYIDNPFAKAKVINLSDKPVTVKPLSKIEDLNHNEIQSPVISIAPKDTAEVLFYTVVNQNDNSKMKIVQAEFYLQTLSGKNDDNFKMPVLINDKNSWNGIVKDLKYFVERDINFSSEFAKRNISENKTGLDVLPGNLKRFETIKILFNEFINKLSYVSDPRASVDKVQFPSETFNLKGGDCDDLSVAFASVLESVGIETAFVDFQNDSTINHVNLLINLEITPAEANLITGNDKKFFVRKNSAGKDELWIPLEITSLTNFETAWEIAADKFQNEAIDNLGLAKGKVHIVDVFY